MNYIFIILLLLPQVLTLRNPADRNLPARMALHIIHKFGEEELKLDKGYTTFLGDKITLTKFKYYLSNIELIQNDGSVWRQPKSYHLMEVNDETSSAFQINLENIPLGEYTQLSFSIGVDSVNNHSGKQEGVLDPDYGMFWMWETGYVFFKIEGFYQTPIGSKGAMVYHVGRDNCYRKINLKIPSNQRQVNQDVNSQLYVIADLKKVFGGFPNASIDLKAPADKSSISVMGGDKALKVANNFAQIFSIKK